LRFTTTGALWARSRAHSQSTPQPARTRIRSLLVAPVLGAALLVSGNLVIAGPAAAAYVPTSYEVRLADMINDYRESRGLKRIWHSSGVSYWAHWRSADMCKRNYFSHTIPAFGSWPGGGNLYAYWKWKPSWYRNAYRFSEIIVRTSEPTGWLTTMLRQWKASSLHNSMLLSYSGKYDRMGVGVYVCPNGRKYATVVFVNLP